MMQVFEQQQSNQGCSKLNTQGIFTGTDECFHLEVLLESFEKDLYLPAVFVDGGDGAGSKVEMVSQQDDLLLVFLIPDDNPAEEMWAALFCSGAGQFDKLICEDSRVLRRSSLFNNLLDSILFLAVTKNTPLAVQEENRA
jgi:hypothetical protein